MDFMTRAGAAVSRFAHLDLGFSPLGRSARRAKRAEEPKKEEDETPEEKEAREKAEKEAKEKAEAEEEAKKARRAERAKKAKKARKAAARERDDDDDDDEDEDEDDEDEDDEDEPDDADEAEMERCEASGFGAALDAAQAYGARLENSRIRKIFESQAAAGRLSMACELAFGKETRGLSADAVIAILTASPVKSRLAANMENAVPRIGSGDARTPTTQQKIDASWERAAAPFMPPKA